ncbi:MAG: hypothetical protein KKA44_02485 [Alphaproteobacteria bacterium]|nr:hypothetical protein [Alphaproteobacteria bacterium]MBU0864928.1 hypothetical protein [Alphaproteobacteria bacterium]MBU1823831.1 hypothetical protein [Alphaproteobacteria bacterium]
MIALAGEVLSSNKYRVARDLTDVGRVGDDALLAEDEFSVVSVVAFETWPQLVESWSEAQADLVELLSRRLARSAPKAWDGYLVLFCAGEPLDRHEMVEIERDTTRVRKIVATGSMLRTSADVARTLDLLLPLGLPASSEAARDVLEGLPDLLKDFAEPASVRVVVDAFRAIEPPLDRLHSHRGGL